MTDADLLETIDHLAAAKRASDGERNDGIEKAIATLAREYANRQQAAAEAALRFAAARPDLRASAAAFRSVQRAS